MSDGANSDQSSVACPHCGKRIPVSIDMLSEAIGLQIEARLEELKREMAEALEAPALARSSDAPQLKARTPDEYPHKARRRGRQRRRR